MHTAKVYQTAKTGAECGVIADIKLDFAKTQQHKKAIAQRLVGGVKGLLAANRVTLVSGVVGGGVIGVEIATIYSTLGCKVTIVEMQPAILPMIDVELTKLLATILQGRGETINF
jgi:pyruvate/2-oxoglutarate dehydrogenase complex dihydrolipoamide dehydrogenase (E3) component